jgi:RNA 3'-terminal phosphate cyclase (ATP)
MLINSSCITAARTGQQHSTAQHSAQHSSALSTTASPAVASRFNSLRVIQSIMSSNRPKNNNKKHNKGNPASGGHNHSDEKFDIIEVALDDSTAGITKSSDGVMTIDGSLLEGGGQVLRNSMAYAALLKKPIEIVKIRANRPGGGGLRNQHLTGIETVHFITGGTLTGNSVRSCEVKYLPGNGDFTNFTQETQELQFSADSKTAGSTGLLIQITLPLLLFLPHSSRIIYRGGTNASHAPLYDYTQRVFLPIFNRLFAQKSDQITLKLVKRGFFPAGGGIIEAAIKPFSGQLPAVKLVERGKITKITAIIVISGRLPLTIAERIEKAVKQCLSSSNYADVALSVELCHEIVNSSDGCSLLMVAQSSTGCLLGSSDIGERGKPSEQLARSAVDELLANLAHSGAVDEYLMDQLIIYLALAKGKSTVKCGPLSLHTRTAIHWAQAITGAKVAVKGAKESVGAGYCAEEGDNKDTYYIEVEGIGYSSRWANQL